jgi:hypothetical protein
MDSSWYYVQGSERVGPVDKDKLSQLFSAGELNEDSYVWKKGFDNWKFLKDVEELSDVMNPPETSAVDAEEDFEKETDPFMQIPPLSKSSNDSFNWDNISEEDPVISIKIGLDRGGHETEYGPFTINQLRKALSENRINEKTFIFTPGLDDWMFFGDTPIYQKITGGLPPTIEDHDRRINKRRPFIARLFFHDNEQVYEGICRDISVGGLQLLVSDCPVQVGDEVNLNVHPDNSDYHFVARGKVVRTLDGERGFSLRFEDLNEEAVNSIHQYIQSSAE